VIEQKLVAFMDAIKDADYYDAALTHMPILPYLVRRCKDSNRFCLAAFIFQKCN